MSHTAARHPELDEEELDRFETGLLDPAAEVVDGHDEAKNLSENADSVVINNGKEKNDKFGEKDTEEFPEGGRGWWVIVGTALIMNTNYGMVNAYGVYQIYYQEKFPEIQSSTISLIGSLQPAVIYLSCLPVVFLHNTIGTRGTIALGSLITVFSLMMLSICKEIWQIYLAQGVLFGIGAGLNFFTGMSVPPEWFKKRRALAVGLTTSGSSIGGIIWPIAVQRLIKEVGFGWANRIIAFIFLGELIISVITVKNRLPTQKKQILPKWSVAKDWRFLLMASASALGFFGLFPPLIYAQEFAQRVPGVPAHTSGYILAILNAFSFFGRVGPGYLGDRYGRLNILVPVLFLCGILPFGLWVPWKHGQAMILCFSIFWGTASGAYISLFPSCIGQLFGIKDLSSRLTIFFLFCFPGSLAGPAIAGTWVHPTGIEGFDKIGIFSGALMLTSAFLILILRLSYSRKLKVFI